MLNLPLSPRHITGPLVFISISVLLWLTEPHSSELLAFDRGRIENMEYWRMLSGHFLHTNTHHLILNLTGLLLLWGLHGFYYSTRQYITVFIFLCLSTSIGLYLLIEEMKWYVGLSGALHGLFTLGAYQDIKRGYKTGWLMLAGVWLKVLYEQWFGASEGVASLIGANVAIDAHLMGTLAGTFITLYYLINGNFRKGKQ